MNEKDIDRIADKILEKMRNNKEIKAEKQLNQFQKTEKLLYELKFLKGAIDTKNILILELQESGKLIQKRNSEINVQSSKVYLSELEKIENRIEKLKDEIDRLARVVEMTEKALETIKSSKYYKIIEMRYFDDMTLEFISENLGIGITTIKRHKNMLIRQLQIIIFSDEVIKNILN